ncbi:MAG: sulfatase-like hydrolase/transferase, partial [Planctomycetales bacterium]|nr:sulfatase-like hydrolase/transferase [Planctomycetales bacterium]
NTRWIESLKIAWLPMLVADLFAFGVLCGDFISNSTWAGHVTYSMILNYSKSLPELVLESPPLAFGSAIGAFGFLLLVWSYARRSDWWMQWFLIGTQNGTNAMRSRLRSLVLMMFYCFALRMSLSQTFALDDPQRWAGEPYSNFFLHFIPAFPAGDFKSVNQLEATASIDVSGPRNVIIIVSDALRADHLDFYGYTRTTSPFLSPLVAAGELVKFDDVYAACPDSVCGIASILSSRGINHLTQDSVHIGDVLRHHGYQSTFIVTGAHEWGGLTHFYRADRFLDGVGRDGFLVNDDLGTINDLRRMTFESNKPQFLYVHLYSSHVLGEKLHKFQRWTPSQEPFNPISQYLMDEEERREIDVNKYDNGVLQADAMIELVFTELRKKGLLDKALVVITADHGEGLLEHTSSRHSFDLFDEFLRIPLLIRDTESHQYATQAAALQIDIAPTLLDALGLEPPAAWRGTSLRRPVPSPRISFHAARITEGWKALVCRSDEVRVKYMWRGPN